MEPEILSESLHHVRRGTRIIAWERSCPRQPLGSEYLLPDTEGTPSLLGARNPPPAAQVLWTPSGDSPSRTVWARPARPHSGRDWKQLLNVDATVKPLSMPTARLAKLCSPMSWTWH